MLERVQERIVKSDAQPAELKSMFGYYGPGPVRPYGLCNYLPVVCLCLYETNWNFAIGWLFWIYEIEFRYATKDKTK